MIIKDTELYSDKGLYGDFTYGSPGVSKSFRLAMYFCDGAPFGKMVVKKKSVPKVLVIGGGNGYEIVYLRHRGLDVTGLELYIPDIPAVKEVTVRGDAANMPFKDKEFDFVFCCETLEHVPMEKCIDILKEIKRVGQRLFMSISLEMDPPYFSHINVRHGYDWLKTFTDLGFDIINAQQNPRPNYPLRQKVIMHIAQKGFFIVANC